MKIVSIALLITTLAACHEQPKTLVKNAGAATLEANNIPAARYGVEGFYTGEFKAARPDDTQADNAYRRIVVRIDSLDGGRIYGHSIVVAHDRPFSGTYIKSGNAYQVTAQEPGDDPTDGRFHFTLDPTTKTLAGDWQANKSDMAISARKYMLHQRTYRYDSQLALPESMPQTFLAEGNDDTDAVEILTSDVVKKNPSVALLTSSDVENMYKGDLEVLRNSIYARHGYVFKNARMAQLFNNYVGWYLPVSPEVTGQLTEIEKKNITLIKRYENHASRYYSSFGR